MKGVLVWAVVSALSFQGAAQLNGWGIGALRIGASVSTVRERYRVVRDTVVEDAEANAQRQIAVDLGRDTVWADVVKDTVWRIMVDHPAYRTADSLGVASTLSQLLAAGTATGLEGDGGRLYITLEHHCGMSFRLRQVIDPRAHRETWPAAVLRRLDAKSQVDEVLIVGCPSRG